MKELLIKVKNKLKKDYKFLKKLEQSEEIESDLLRASNLQLNKVWQCSA